MSVFHISLFVLVGALLVQTTAVILLGIAVSKSFQWNAAARHTVLFATLLAVSALPVANATFRAFRISLLPTITNAIEVAIADKPSVQEPRPVLSYVPITGPLLEKNDAEAVETKFLDATTVILLVWGAGFVLLFTRFFLAVLRLAWIRRKALLGIDDKLNQLSNRMSKRLGLKRGPPVFLSDHVRTPVAVGILRPTILLPSDLVSRLSEQELISILLHELAHIRRRDHLVLFLQKLIAIVFWPQPFLYLLNRALSQAREEICDNHVLRFSERVCYGETLLKLTTNMSPAFSLGLHGSTWKLEHRISHLLSDRRKLVTTTSPLLRCIALALAGIVTVTLSLGTPIGAEENGLGEPAEEHSTDNTFDGKHDYRRIQFETKDGNLFIGEPGKGVIFLTNDSGAFDASDVSPGDKGEADRLKEEYDMLNTQQKETAAKLKDLEAALKKLGVKLRRNAQFNVVRGNVASIRIKEIPAFDFAISVVDELATGSAPAAKPSRSVRRSVKVTPANPALPTISSIGTKSERAVRAVRSAKPSESSLERRLERLERLIEQLIESNN